MPKFKQKEDEMKLNWKVTIRQQNLAPEYRGLIEFKLNGTVGTFSFHYKLDPGYRITAADHPFLAFKKGEDDYLRVRWPVSQHGYNALSDEKQVMLQLLAQIVELGVRQIISEHGLDSPTITSAVRSATKRVLQSEKDGNVEVEDTQVRLLIQAACAAPK